MLAILAAAAVAAAASEPPKIVAYVATRGARSCEYWLADPVKNRAPPARTEKLVDLPLPNHELAVLRTDENGCSVATTVAEKVSGDGRSAGAR